jgi:hypothetical protein
MANAIAVLPVPGGPAISNALPAIFFDLINSTTIPPASRANSWPTIPDWTSIAKPSSFKPKPLIWLCKAILYVFVVDLTSSILKFKSSVHYFHHGFGRIKNKEEIIY